METLRDYNYEEEEKKEVYMQLYYKGLIKAGIDMEGYYDPIYDQIDELMEVEEIIEELKFIREEEFREERKG